MSNPWFRLYNEIIDDWKIRLLAFEDRWHYVAILCIKNSGDLDKGLDEAQLFKLMAIKLGVHSHDLESIRDRLMEGGLIDSMWQPLAWSERQFKTDSSTERVRAYRERQKKRKPEQENGTSETARNVTVTAQEPETEPETDKRGPQHTLPGVGGPKGPPPCPHEEIISLFHEILPELPRVRIWKGANRQWLQARWREDPKRQNLEWWEKFFRYIRESDFLMGRASPSSSDRDPFRARLRWIVKESNFIKIYEGDYHR